MKKTIIIRQKYSMNANPKSHSFFKMLQSKYITINLEEKDIKKFINDYNNENVTIIFYQNGYDGQYNFILNLIDIIKNSIMKACFIFFSFDYWIWENEKNYKLFNNLFKSTNFKVFCNAYNINQLNKLHNFNYNKYEKNIIFGNIWNCYESSFINFNTNPTYKLLVSGAVSKKNYPERYIFKKSDNKNICLYKYNYHDLKDNNNYNLTLNKYFCSFSSSVYVKIYNENTYVNTHCILLKTFEILSSGSLLVIPKSEENFIKKIGLEHNINCYLIDFNKNINNQIDYIFNNIEFYDSVRLNGYKLANDKLNDNIHNNKIIKLLEL